MIALALTLLISTSAQDPVPGSAAPARQDPAPTASPPRADGSAVATLQGCAMEGERWVCRYQMPEIRVVEQAPQSLGIEAAPTTAGPADAGVLSEEERAFVARCADAGWLSLCLPGDRRRARELRDAAQAYEARRRDVAALLAQGRCDAAVTTALEAGHLNLAREARTFCGR
ncbi:MAG: hypothetical protein KJ676_10990 [Alphaproteobacteria bacterium]|nr:hypothetical protein [Alphaproteobacteria bacterium]MBU2350726.1 hypothetical protein [Alphaproteobacteria bacterium]MBU2382992.1 hypothetical protein [Alphaproteobacteria bacterium]